MIRRGRGFTLLEVLISMAISMVGIAAALAVLSTQSAFFTQEAGLGSAIAQSQTALDAVERAVRLAGTGIDPQMAFDFDFYKCVLPGGALSMTDSANCNAATRDSATQPDELVVSYRDPAYSTAAPADARAGCNAGNASTFVGRVWGVTAASNSSVTLVLKPGDTIYRGQVLQMVCSDGATYAYATVSSAKTSVAAGAGGCSTVSLNLYTAGIDVHDPFNQPSILANACFSTGGATSARAYSVRRNRFFIRRDLTTNTVLPQPYLMLDQGLDLDDDGALTDADLLPIAIDILDLQVAYATEQPGIMALSTAPTGWVQATYVVDSNTNGVWGDDPGQVEQLTEPVYAGAGNTPTAQFTAANAAFFAGVNQACTSFAGAAFYQYPCIFGTTPVETSHLNNIHAYRWTAWPGNISQVQIGLIGMGGVIEQTGITSDELNLPTVLNRSALTAPAYNAWYLSLLPRARKRAIVQTGVRPANIALSSLFWN